MNPKIWIPLTAAAITGTAAAWTGYHLVSGPSAPTLVQATALDDVVVAARPIPAGTELTAEDLSIVRVEQGAIASAASSTEVLIGRITAEPIAQGQFMGPSLLATDGTMPGLAAALPNGYRALTVQLDPHSGLQGLLHPEAHVDIIASLGSGDETAARTIAQNVRVLAVSGRLHGEKHETTGEEEASLSNRYNVTLMVTMEQAAAIELAADSGMPRLVLRPSSDQDIQPFAGLTLAQLRGDSIGDPFANSDTTWEPNRTLPVSTDPDPVPVQNPEPTTRPADPVSPVPVVEVPRSRPRFHVIEVIRAGVVSRTEMPLRSGPRPQPATERAVVNNDTSPAAE